MFERSMALILWVLGTGPMPDYLLRRDQLDLSRVGEIADKLQQGRKDLAAQPRNGPGGCNMHDWVCGPGATQSDLRAYDERSELMWKLQAGSRIVCCGKEVEYFQMIGESIYTACIDCQFRIATREIAREFNTNLWRAKILYNAKWIDLNHPGVVYEGPVKAMFILNQEGAYCKEVQTDLFWDEVEGFWERQSWAFGHGPYRFNKSPYQYTGTSADDAKLTRV